jgi:hypothetical protein
MRSLRWGWIVLGGFLGEFVGIVLLMGLRLLHGYGPVSPEPLSAVGNAAFRIELFVVMAVFGWWVARKASAQLVLHGVSVGVAAVVIYEILVMLLVSEPIPMSLSYVAAHALKTAGGAAGGILAARRRSRASPVRAAS